jgi:hypothetical protein
LGADTGVGGRFATGASGEGKEEAEKAKKLNG